MCHKKSTWLFHLCFQFIHRGLCVLPQSVWVGFTRRWGGAAYSPHFCIMQRKRKEGHYSFAALGRSCRAQGGAASQCL